MWEENQENQNNINEEKSNKYLKNLLDELEKTKKEIEEERDRTNAIISNLVDGILFFDEKKNISLVNPKAEEILEIKAEDVLNKNILELTKFPIFLPLIDVLGAEVRTLFRKEIKLKENLIFEVSSVPLSINQKRIGNLVVLHDITREKLIEKLKNEFVSLSAHQLRTPLSAIKWIIESLLNEEAGKITEEQKELLIKAKISNNRMIKLIDDLLDVTKIEEGRYIGEMTLTNLEPIIESAIDTYKEEIKRKKIRLEVKGLSDNLPKVMADVEKIKIAFQNIFDNAVKYTKEGGKIFVSLNYDEKNKEILIQVKDTGIGIPKNQQERIFTKFFRGSNATPIDTEGSGLGLFLTKNIIEAHYGKIWFESEENKGTTFYFTLPVKESYAEYITKEFY